MYQSIDALISLAMAKVDAGMCRREAIRQAAQEAATSLVATVGVQQVRDRITAALLHREQRAAAWNRLIPGLF